jgi:hypothetical protein
MSIAARSWRLFGRVAVAGYCLAALAACGTTGHSFDSSALELIVPGQTTLAQASALLGSEPVDVYRQANGAATARWAEKASLVTDAIYFQQELWLAFGPDGRFERIVKKMNVPSSLKRVATPANVTLSGSSNPGIPASSSGPAHSPLSAPGLIDSGAVTTYPLK